MEEEIFFCKKCYENEVYSPLIYEINENLTEIKYSCIKHNENNIDNSNKMKLNEDIKEKLKYCRKHKKIRNCAWCNKCKNNICFLCICQEKHDYTLYCYYYPNHIELCKIINVLKQFLYLRIDCDYLSNSVSKNDYKPNFELIKEIKKYINNYEIYYKLVIEEDLINYQLLLNLKYNNDNYERIIDKFKSIILKEIVKKYSDKNLSDKYKEDIISFPVTEIDDKIENIEIISLDLEEENELSNQKSINNKEKNKSNKPFIIYYKFKYFFQLYDENGNLINEISHTDYIFDKCEVFQYQKNILLLRFHFKFLFLYISTDLLKYEFSNIFVFDFGCSLDQLKNVILLNDDYIGLLCQNYLYYIKMDKEKIFKKDIPKEQNALIYFEVQSSKELINQKIDNIFPIYENGKIKKIIGLFLKDNDLECIKVSDKEYQIYVNDLLTYILNFENYYDNELIQYFKNKKEIIINKIIDIFNNEFLQFINNKIIEYYSQRENNFTKKYFFSYQEKTYFQNEMKKYLINKFNDLYIDETKKELLVNEIISNFKLFEKERNLDLKLKMSIIIFNSFPSINKAFTISFLEDLRDFYINKNLKLHYFCDYLIFFFYRNAYVISLKENEIVLIYELNYNKIHKNDIDKFKYFNYDEKEYYIQDEEYNEICQKLINDTENIKKENIEKYDWTFQKYDWTKSNKYINFKENWNILEKDRNKIIVVDHLENRLIQIIKLNLQINNNIINIDFNDKKISFNSIVDPLKYKLIFQNYIK